jgi:hypothetical protein
MAGRVSPAPGAGPESPSPDPRLRREGSFPDLTPSGFSPSPGLQESRSRQPALTALLLPLQLRAHALRLVAARGPGASRDEFMGSVRSFLDTVTGALQKLKSMEGAYLLQEKEGGGDPQRVRLLMRIFVLV